MISTIQNKYFPDSVSAPGETLLEVLSAQGISQADLAERTGRPTKTINEIIKGKAAITPETAIQLERALGTAASFWITREQQYREFLARERELAQLARQVSWLKTVPYRAMMKNGWIPAATDKITILQNVLTFFGVASIASWDDVWGDCKVHFRRSTAFKSSPGAIAAWLRRGELEAQNIRCGEFALDNFKKVLTDIRKLTGEMPTDFGTTIVQKCSAVGVRVVFIPELPGTCAWGATRWLMPTCALMQLSLRYKTDDHFWFTFFHEAGHIVLHGKKDIFIDNQHSSLDKKEAEANTFASDWLIPPDQYRVFSESGANNCAQIRRFAEQLEIAPGIVVGRLQHDGLLRHDHCYHLKRTLSWQS
jgi:HTH-type transcriptional regulator / antitoxin HigA